MKVLKIIAQITLLTLFSLGGDFISASFNLPVPGNILGLLALFLLLVSGVVKLSWVELGASWLLAELLLFFVPSAAGIIQYGELMKNDGLKLLLVVILSLTAVMSLSGVITEFLVKRREQRRATSC